MWIFPMTMKVDERLGGNSVNPAVKFQSDINCEYSIPKLQDLQLNQKKPGPLFTMR